MKLSFIDKKMHCSACSPVRQTLSSVMTFPPWLKILSEGVLVAGTHRYFTAIFFRVGRFSSWSRHHKRGSASLSRAGWVTYLNNSDSNFWSGVWTGTPDPVFSPARAWWRLAKIDASPVAFFLAFGEVKPSLPFPESSLASAKEK